MKVKANYIEINDVGCFVYKKAEELEENIKEVLELINSVNSCWNGIDADNFVLNSSTYVTKMGNKVNELKNISAFMKNVAKKYEYKVLAFDSEIKKEGLHYEKS